VRAALAVLGATVRARPRAFLGAWLAALVAYHLVLLAPFARFGALPTYARLHDVVGGVVESLRLRPPLPALWELVAHQPVYEIGVQDAFGFVPIQYVGEVHGVATALGLPPLVAALVLLQARVRAAGRGGRVRAPVALTVGGPVVSLLGAGTSAVACCAASTTSGVLATLGLGAAGAGLVARAELLEGVGLALALAGVAGLARWLAGHAPDTPGGACRPDAGARATPRAKETAHER